MLPRTEFLALVLPPLQEGECYCVTGIKGDLIRQQFVGSVGAISDHADELGADGFNVFFALAKFGPSENGRTTKNALGLKSFFMDLDCGEGKPYADLNAGIAALKSFCKNTGLSKPTLVKSGRGAHVYWVLEGEMPRSEWVRRAETLKALCKLHGFHVDPSVTGDAARILRVPETKHVKDPANPLPVEVLSVGPLLSDAIIHKVLPESDEHLLQQTPRYALDSVTQALMGNKQSRFRTILIKSTEGKGCAQLLHIFENQAEIDEPLWRAGLSIAERCVDRDKAIHLLSNKHPDYTPEETENKASRTAGPYLCETFKELRPAGCEGCPHKISSPIQLGTEIAVSTEGAKVVDTNNDTREEMIYEIPAYPFPYLRGKNGGVYVRGTREDETGNEVEVVDLVYNHDIYVVKRMVDPDVGETLLLRLHRPHDGVLDFIIPLTATVGKERFSTAMAFHGIAVPQKRQDALMLYIIKWVEKLQMDLRAEKAHRQFGWLPDESGIVIGEREIRATEIAYNPPSSATLPNIPYFRPKGDFHTWKNIINHYAKPGLEYRAFPFFLGFGTLLMRFTALDGFLVNLVGRTSGTGKSTVLHAINSIYGHPKLLLLNPKDTYNARMQRLGVMQNLAVTMDEITNMAADAMSQQIYDVTSGRAKNRMRQHDNAERSNNTNFQTGMITSSNRSVVDTLLSLKALPDGEMKRILEITYPASSNEDATWSRLHFEPLMENYGHAIQPFAQALVAQSGQIREKLNEVRVRVDQEAGIHNSERYWALTVALALTGGAVAQKLGLHDIPTKPVFQYGIKLIHRAREISRSNMFDADAFLGVFMQRHFSEILIINGKRPARGLEQAPIREPRGQLTVRYEPDTKLLFVSANAYRAECNKSQTNFEESLEPYKRNGALLVHEGGEIVKRKRLFSGTTASTNTQTTCLWFDTRKLDAFNEDTLLDPSIGPDDSD